MITPMKKDEALSWRERVLAQALETARKQGFEALAEDGKLYHDEIDQVGRWAQRFSLAGRWPHAGAGAEHPACPGLRYEVWYFAGKAKEETALLLVLAEPSRGLEPLCKHLAPTFKTLVEGGKYARRYTKLEPLVTRFYPEAVGVGRRVPLAKLTAGWSQLLEDSLKPLDAAFAQWDGAEGASERYMAECAAYDPLAALRQKFG